MCKVTLGGKAHSYVHRLAVFRMARTLLHPMPNKLQALAERRAPQCSSQIPREKGRKIKDVQIDLSLVHTVLPRLNGQHGSAGAASVDAT